MRLVQRAREVRKSLKTRVLTGFALVAYSAVIFVFAALASPSRFAWFDFNDNVRAGCFAVFVLLILILALMGGSEASRLVFKRRKFALSVVLFCLLAIILAPAIPYAVYLYGFQAFESPYLVMIGALALAVVVSAIALVVTLKAYGMLSLRNGVSLLFLVIWLGIFFFCLCYLALAKGWTTLLLAVLIPLLADSFAYFGGTFFGRHKMAPTISPKKTWEGAVCAMVLTTLTMSLVLYGYQQDDSHQMFNSLFSANLSAEQLWPIIVFGSMGLTFLSIVGDLLFSYIKRKHGIKDFSTVFPGHGGVCDRADSLSFVVIAYSAVIFIIAAASVFYAAS